MDPVAPPQSAASPTGWRQELTPLVLYAAIPVCLFLPITLAGNLVFGSSDLYFHLLNRLYPVKWVLGHGLLPLWNPFVNSGMPFVGDMQSVMFSPFAPLYYLFPVHWALFLAYLISFTLAGYGTYRFLRQLGNDSLPAAFGGLVYCLNSVIISQVFNGNIHHVNTYSLIPWAFLFLERGLVERRPRLFLACGAILALMVFCGHPQFVLYTVTGFGLYVPLRGWQLRLPPRWLLAMFVLLGAVGLGLAALQLLPSWEFRHWTNRGGGLPYDVVARDSLPWQNLTMFVMPYFFGCPGTNTLWQIMDYAATNVYFGVVSLVLAALAVTCLRRQARLTWLFAGLWLFFVAMALGSHLPLYRLLYTFVPGYDTFRGPGRVQVLIGFSQAVLAGFGLGLLLRQEQTPARAARVLRWLLAVGLVCLVAAGLAALFRHQLFELVAPYGERLLRELYYGWNRGRAHPFEYHLQRMPVAVNLAISQGLRAALLLAVATGLCLAALRRPAWRQPLAGALLLLLAVDLLSFARPMVKPCPPAVYFGSHPALDFLRRQPLTGRVLWHDGVLQYQGGMFDGVVRDVRAYNPVVIQRYLELLAANDSRETEKDLFYSYLNKPDGKLVRLLGVQYFLRSSQEVPAPCTENWRPLARFPGLRFRHVEYKDFQMIFPAEIEAFACNDPLPRAWFAHRAVPVPRDTSVLAQLQEAGFDPRQLAYYEGGTREVGGPAAAAAEPGTARISRFDPNTIVVSTESAAERFLVLSEVFYPGWCATVDGQPTEVFRTDHVLRGVIVPAGKHEVRLSYRPATVRVGGTVTGVTLVVTVAAWFVLRRRERGRGSVTPPGPAAPGPAAAPVSCLSQPQNT